MLRKLAVALLAATVFTAPALAQDASGNAKTRTPAAATASPSTGAKATTKTTAQSFTAKPKHKSAKLHKRHRHLAHVKHVKHVSYAKATPSTGNVKHHVRHVTKKPLSTTGSAAATNAKPKSGAN